MASKSEIHPFVSRKVTRDKQSVLLEGPERIRVSVQCDHENNNYFIDKLYDDVTTTYECFLRGERDSNNGPCLGWRPTGLDPYKWLSYSEVRRKFHCFGSALLEKGFSPSDETKIGIYSQNRQEWVFADMGCVMFSMVTVPLYSTLGPEGRQHIISITNMKLIVVDTMQKVNDLLEGSQDIPSLKHIVVMEDPIPEETKSNAEKAGIEVVVFDDFIDLGEKNIKEPIPCKSRDVALIQFTSGTTGVPKGAVITHANIISNLAGIYSMVKGTYDIPPGCVSISFLPLAHAYEHTNQVALFLRGGANGFFRGDIKGLIDDIQCLKPDVFPCVPRLANKLYDKVMGGVNAASFVKRKVFEWAYYSKKVDVDQGILRKDTWSDYFVFKKIQDLLGGNVKWIVTGSAPISTEVLEFFRIAFGCPISEGYGQTEATAAVTFTLGDETDSGHVGATLPSCMVKLVDVKEMGYLASEDKGEVCVKGPQIFSQYFKSPEKTSETIDADGWLHTGDIGMWLPNGALKIIDRKKHIFKLSQGEYVAPEKVENVITRSLLLAQAFVYGNSLQSYNVAILVPDEEELRRFAQNNDLKGTIEELCKNETVQNAVRVDMEKISNKAKLCGFEKVKEFILHPEPFSIENGLLTPTMKNKRATIKDQFIDEIDAMYAKKR